MSRDIMSPVFIKKPLQVPLDRTRNDFRFSEIFIKFLYFIPRCNQLGVVKYSSLRGQDSPVLSPTESRPKLVYKKNLPVANTRRRRKNVKNSTNIQNLISFSDMSIWTRRSCLIKKKPRTENLVTLSLSLWGTHYAGELIQLYLLHTVHTCTV